MTTDQAKALGVLVRNARLERGLSFGQLATLVPTTKAWLLRLEDGRYADPRPELISRVADALKIDPARIDRVSGGLLAQAMPSPRTYFRSTTDLPLSAVKEIEAAIEQIRQQHKAKPDQHDREGSS